MSDDRPTVHEILRAAPLVRFRILRAEGEERRDGSWRRVTCHVHREELPPRSRELAVSYRREVKQMRVVSGLEEAHRLLADGLVPVSAGARSTGPGPGPATERDAP